jgi:hypothetical protein
MPKRTAETTYLDFCAALESEVAAKLGRELNDFELAGIRNAGSGMMLESVERSIFYATDLAQLAASLQEGGIAFESRRAELCKSAVKVLEERLGRQLNELQKRAVEGCRYWTDVLRLSVDLHDCESKHREIVFAKFLQNS